MPLHSTAEFRTEWATEATIRACDTYRNHYDVTMTRKAQRGSGARRSFSPRVPITIRLPRDVVERINQQVDDRDVPISRNNWFLEAAIEKLRRSDEGSHGKK